MFNNPLLLRLVLPLILGGIFLVLILHHRGVRWFYHLGPPLLNEEWQTSASESALKKELARFAGGGGLIVYHWKDGLGCRLRFLTKSGKYARAVITTKPMDNGAAVIYQVRVSMALPILFAFMYCAIAFSQRVQWFFWVHALMVIFWTYWAFGRNAAALDELARLPALRYQLQLLGVHVCTYCGYDLFGREPTCKCPECGRSASLYPATDLTEIPRLDTTK